MRKHFLTRVADVEIALVVERGGVERLVDALLGVHVALDLFVSAVRVEVAGGATRQHVAGGLPARRGELAPEQSHIRRSRQHRRLWL